MKLTGLPGGSASAAIGGIAAGVPALLAGVCGSRECTACFGCAATVIALGGAWLGARLKSRIRTTAGRPHARDRSTDHSTAPQSLLDSKS